MRQVSSEDMAQLATLCSFKFSVAEQNDYQYKINQLLGSFSELDELDLEEVAPTFRVGEEKSASRQDVAIDGPVSPKELIDLAPENKDNAVKVPKVL